jgi:hypothetical protein
VAFYPASNPTKKTLSASSLASSLSTKQVDYHYGNARTLLSKRPFIVDVLNDATATKKTYSTDGQWWS